jgi:hypothetical protein
MPLPIQASAQRESQLRHLRESMRRANVPEGAINQVVEDQTQTFYFSGYVTTILYDDQRTEVSLSGETNIIFHFPPNPSKYLQEIIRAQTHPHLAVYIAAKISMESSPLILSLGIGLDYPYPWPNNRPPFDNRTISPAQNTTLTTTTTTGNASL